MGKQPGVVPSGALHSGACAGYRYAGVLARPCLRGSWFQVVVLLRRSIPGPAQSAGPRELWQKVAQSARSNYIRIRFWELRRTKP